MKTKKIINRGYVLVKYFFSAGISFIIDQLLFNILMLIFKKNSFIIICKLFARAVSSLINYFLNANVVFKGRSKNAVIKYYLLVIIQAFVSSISIYILKNVFSCIHVSIISIVVDCIIFVVNYFVQKKYIFINKIK